MKSVAILHAEINELNRQIAALMNKRGRLEIRIDQRKQALAPPAPFPFGLRDHAEISRQFYD